MSEKKSIFKPFPSYIKTGGHPKKIYKGNMSQDQRIRMSARVASGNGRCWWIYKFLMHNPLYGSKR